MYVYENTCGIQYYLRFQASTGGSWNLYSGEKGKTTVFHYLHFPGKHLASEGYKAKDIKLSI